MFMKQRSITVVHVRFIGADFWKLLRLRSFNLPVFPSSLFFSLSLSPFPSPSFIHAFPRSWQSAHSGSAGLSRASKRHLLHFRLKVLEGDNNFSAFHEILAPAYKNPKTFTWRLTKRRQILWMLSIHILVSMGRRSSPEAPTESAPMVPCAMRSNKWRNRGKRVARAYYGNYNSLQITLRNKSSLDIIIKVLYHRKNRHYQKKIVADDND